jgi:hypothetical protein
MGLGKRLSQFLKRFEVEVERFARIGERSGQRVVAGDDFRNVGKVDRVTWLLGIVTDGEDVTPVGLGCDNQRPRISKTRRTSRGLDSYFTLPGSHNQQPEPQHDEASTNRRNSEPPREP